MLLFGVVDGDASQPAGRVRADRAGRLLGLARVAAPDPLVGLGFIFIPVTVAALSDLSPQIRGNATGLFNLTRELGGSIGTAWMGMVVTDGIATHSSQIGSHISFFDPITQEQWLNIARRGFDPAGILAHRVTTEAMVLSFNDGFRLTMASIGLGLVTILLLKKPPARGGGAPSGAH